MFYLHADGPNILKNVNYLVLQGGHDSDIWQYLGSQQWQRTKFSDDNYHIKMALYIYRANHWNFNQSMSVNVGKGDSKEYDSRPITPENQEKLTKVFVSVFLEASLFDKKEYIELLKRPRPAQYGIPEDIYISRYQESDCEMIDDFGIKYLKEGIDNE